MPTYSRKYLRQTLGRSHLRDTWVSATSQTLTPVNYSLNIVDGVLADLSLSGQGLYVGAWVYLSGSEFRVASFNVATGALVSQAATNLANLTIVPSVEYERHDMLPASDKNRAIDETIKRLWSRGEVGIDTVERAHVYPLPAQVVDVLDAYYFASPQATLGRDQKRLTRWETVTTPTGVELRIDPALMASQQIVLDAITAATLGAADAATVNIPDERLVLFGAEAECWNLMVRRAPRGAGEQYESLRNAAARQFNLLSARFKTPVDRPVRIVSSGDRVF